MKHLLRRSRRRRRRFFSPYSQAAIRSFEDLEPRHVLDSVVVFNELMYHPTESDQRGEWIELKNLLSVDVDLSNWRLSDGVEFAFPEGSTIPADGYLLVAQDPDLWSDDPNVEVIGPWQGALSNGGERVELRNNSNRIMDEVEYADEDPWPAGADGAGPSLAKQDEFWTSRDVRNWALSTSRQGTPGRSNLPVTDPSQIVKRPVSWDAAWAYDAAGNVPDPAWFDPQFDDSSWATGDATFFAGEGAATGDSLTVDALDPAGDADIDASRQYTHALDFGDEDGGATINGQSFRSVNSSGLISASDFTWTNSSGIRFDGTVSDVPPLNGPLHDLFQDYASNPLHRADGTAELTLVGLEIGTRYRLRLYSRQLNADPRPVTLEFQQGDRVESLSLDEDAPELPDVEAPYAVTFEFTATAPQLTVRAIQHTSNRPWIWYALTNEVVQQTGNTELPLAAATRYFRHEFTYDGDPLALHELRLQLLLDDGAVVYLNGTEIHRDNMPAGPIDAATSASTDILEPWRRSVVSLPADSLRFGESNVLAVEVHQSANGDPDLRYAAQLEIVETPRPPFTPPEVRLNEISAPNASQRFVELMNQDSSPIDLGGLTVRWQGDSIREMLLPEMPLAPGSFFTMTIPASWPTWEEGNLITLGASDGSGLVDAQTVRQTGLARSAAHDSQWLIPDRATPGSANSFMISDQIVINEIMYHAAPEYATLDTPFQEDDTEWIELYNRSATPADLSRWTLSGGIAYTFPRGTIIPPDGYLVVSRDATALRSAWPNAPIIGDFQGQLGNAGDNITLSDAVGNPVDEVHYYDKGSWPGYADGGGSSLELRDPFADNRRPEAWAASREGDRSPWIEVSYEGRGRPPQGSNDPAEWNELILGLLDAGEILIDDISVIEDPSGSAIERMQNGSFEQADAHWRFLGNHGQHGATQVIVDPSNPQNHVLRIVATGATEHMHNHVETTFVGNARISSSTTYRISFKAKWLAGSPQINSRLYFNRLAATHILPQPAQMGTPGQVNSQRNQNVGPTFHNLSHQPAVPAPGDTVDVSVLIDDPDGVASAELFYRRDGEVFQTVTMIRGEGDEYRGSIPGFAAGQIVQFYVVATDGQGTSVAYPPGGADSRALYRVDDGRAADGPRHSLRIIVTDEDLDKLFNRPDYTSNLRHGVTVIWQESQVYYDVELRLKGSGFSRGSAATGYNMRFSPDQLFLGEHDVIAVDRQGGPWGIGASHRELTIKHIANRAGNIPMMYDDVIDILGPRDSLSGSGQLLAARYDDVFLESQFENGGEGTRFKFELIYYSTLTVDGDPESVKLPPSSSRAGVFPVNGVDMTYMGDDPNAYRWNYLIRNNRDRDDYSAIIAFTDAMRLGSSTVGGPLDLRTQEAMDVDQWMRLFAFESLAGINDTFNQGLPHNLQLYVRPSDQRVVALPWDMDFSLHQPTNMNIYGTGSRLSRVINIPTNRRVFQQHLLDIIETSYNVDYLSPWVSHLATRAQQNVSSEILNYVQQRRNYVLSQLAAEIPFEVTTPNKDNLQVDTPSAILEGRGWIDVREIRLVGEDGNVPLIVQWLDDQNWQVQVPLSPGRQTLQLEAVNLRGDVVGSAQTTITSSATNTWQTGLRVTEVHYHPADPSPAELAAGWNDANQFEFIEVTNIGDAPLPLDGVRFVQDHPDGTSSGIAFEFPAIEIQPGQAVVAASNQAAFSARYGDQVLPIGQYVGRLSNGGERLRLVGPSGEVIHDFTYDDAWYGNTDGDGMSLTVRSPDTASTELWNDAAAWFASRELGGTPGFSPRTDLNQDQVLDVQDVDFLCAAMRNMDPMADLNGDGLFDVNDIDRLVEDAMSSVLGDVNFDGRFDSSDLVRIFQMGEYEDDSLGNSRYSSGDWNCDGDFTTSDLVIVFQRGQYQS